MTELRIICRDLQLSFDGRPVIRDLSLDVPTGSFFALLGPSGSGKTTLLRLLAGFETPERGEIRIGAQTVACAGGFVRPERRHVGMVFQDYALFPHMTVRQNIGFGLGRDDRARVDALLALTGLTPLADRFPADLSGGEQQRVAIARALAPEPAVILLDEPFSNLDAALRGSMRAEVRRILKAAGATAVFVTHDQAEALSLADDVGVMMDGRILQCADAQTVYRRPANPAVARFVGEANIFPGRLDDATFGCAAGRFPYTGSGAPTAMLLRPEDLEIHPDGDLHADAGTIEYYGHDVLLHGTLGDGARVLIRLLSTSGFPAPGSDLTLRVRPGVRPHFFD